MSCVCSVEDMEQQKKQDSDSGVGSDNGDKRLSATEVCVSLHLSVGGGGDFVHLYQYDCNMFKYRCIVMCVYVSMHKYALDMYLNTLIFTPLILIF